jgi:hypothetical protein
LDDAARREYSLDVPIRVEAAVVILYVLLKSVSVSDCLRRNC